MLYYSLTVFNIPLKVGVKNEEDFLSLVTRGIDNRFFTRYLFVSDH